MLKTEVKIAELREIFPEVSINLQSWGSWDVEKAGNKVHKYTELSSSITSVTTSLKSFDEAHKAKH